MNKGKSFARGKRVRLAKHVLSALAFFIFKKKSVATTRGKLDSYLVR